MPSKQIASRNPIAYAGKIIYTFLSSYMYSARNYAIHYI